jgi:excisionase family DNA binding protein
MIIDDDRKPLSPTNAAIYFNIKGFSVSPRTINRMVGRGELNAHVTAGGWYRIRRSELDRWIAEHS